MVDRRYLIGTSLKMYFTHARTLDWCAAVREIADTHEATRRGVAQLFVLPSYVSIPAALSVMDGAADVGAQDIAAEDSGAFTGEVSGKELSEIGCRLAEVGHAERRRMFGDTDPVVREKTDAALRNALTPVVCIGEHECGAEGDVIAECARQLDDALLLARERGRAGQLIVAYEPQWAIGAPEPAPSSYVRAVCSGIRSRLAHLDDFAGSTLIYGGSAGPGLLSTIADSVDGLFLGRFAHDPGAVREILDEVAALVPASPGRGPTSGW